MAKAAVIMGGMSAKIAEWIKECDYNSDVAPSIDVFLNTALRKSDTYARILLLCSLLNEQSVAELKNYCKSRSNETVVVIFGQKGKDEDAVRKYLQIYSSTTACSMILGGKFSKELALTAVSMPAATITERYGIKDIFNVEVARTSYATPEPEVPQNQQVQQEQPQKQEKRSVLGALFGGKKKGKKNETQEQAPMNNSQNIQQLNPMNNMQQSQPMSNIQQSMGGYQQPQPMNNPGFAQSQPIQATQSQYDANVMAGSNNVMNNQVNQPEPQPSQNFSDFNGFGGSDGVPVGGFDNQQPIPQDFSGQLSGFDSNSQPTPGQISGFGSDTQSAPDQVSGFGGTVQPAPDGFPDMQSGFDSNSQPIPGGFPDTQTQQGSFGGDIPSTSSDFGGFTPGQVDLGSFGSSSQPTPDTTPLQMGFDNVPQSGGFDTPQPVDFGTPPGGNVDAVHEGFSQAEVSMTPEQSFEAAQQSFGGSQFGESTSSGSDFGVSHPGMNAEPGVNSGFIQPQPQPGDNMGFGGQVQQPQLQPQNNDFYGQNPYGQQTYQPQPLAQPTPPTQPQPQNGYQGWQNPPMQPNFQGDNGSFGQPPQSMYEQNVNVNTSNWSIPNSQPQAGQNSQWPDTSQVQDTVVEMDFGAVAFDQQIQQPAVPTSQVVADDSLSALSGVGLEDNKVRERETAAGGKTRVITKTVVKNISSSSDLIKGMSSGTTRKILVVTGDRGTGVTSTAFTLAMQLAKKVEVLYFDCDIENHGLLNYIDYNKFCGFEDICRNGISLCRSSKAFDSCVTLWDDGLSILTSDFSCDIKTDMLTLVGSIVAERCLDYGLTIVDCPIKFLPCINELLLSANVALCVEGSKRGFMNMLCQLEGSPLEMRYKRRMCSSGTMLLTKCVQNTDLKKLVNYIISIYEPDGADWMAINKAAFNGKWTDKMIAAVLS